MNGLRGMPFSRSSWTIELKALPEGSRPTRRQSASPTLPRARVSVNTLDTLWIENGVVRVPGGQDLPVDRGDGDAELAGVDLGELGDVGGDLAALGRLRHAVGDLRQDRRELGHPLFPGCSPLSLAPDGPASYSPAAGRGGHGRVIVNGVMIEDTFAEAFPMRATRLVITADEPRWARTAAEAMTGFATSVIACGCEAGIERELAPEETPDGRPGDRRPAVRDGRAGSGQAARRPRRPVRADLRRHRLLLRPGRRRHGRAGPVPALLRRRLPEQQAAGRPALLAHPGDGRRVPGRGCRRRPGRGRRRQFPDPVHHGRGGAGRGAGGDRRHAQAAQHRHALPRRRGALGLQGRLALQGPDRLDQRRLLPDHPRPERRGPPCRTRSGRCWRSSSTA